MVHLINQSNEQHLQTHQVYKTLPSSLESCSCLYCQNYINSIPSLPDWIQCFANRYGIDLAKAVEIMQIDQEGEHHQFLAIYHVVGEAVVSSYSDEEITLFLDTEDLDFVPDELPTPVVQVMMELWLPWVVEPLEIQG